MSKSRSSKKPRAACPVLGRCLPRVLWTVRTNHLNLRVVVSRIAPSRSPRFQASYPPAHDLHVLLRHRLLREPGGFEGFVWLWYCASRRSSHHANPQVGSSGTQHAGLALASSMVGPRPRRDHRAAGCPDLDAIRPRLEPICKSASDTLVARSCASKSSRPRTRRLGGAVDP